MIKPCQCGMIPEPIKPETMYLNWQIKCCAYEVIDPTFTGALEKWAELIEGGQDG